MYIIIKFTSNSLYRFTFQEKKINDIKKILNYMRRDK